MNVVQSIAVRERGYGKIQGYDVALQRLKCYREDLYEGVEGNIVPGEMYQRPPVFACQFASAPGYEHVIAFANEDGRVALQDTQARSETQGPLQGIQAHKNAIFDVAWMPQELKLITASGDRSACLWDASASDLQEIETFYGHTHTIKSAVFRHQDKAVFATGARDGAIMIWDIRANHSGQPKPDNAIFNAHKLKTGIKGSGKTTPKANNSTVPSVTALAFQDDYNLISSSAGDGMIKVWDLRKNYSVHKKQPLAKHVMLYGGKSSTYNGFTSLLISPSSLSLYASCIDGKIYSYNISSYNPKPVAEYYGHVTKDQKTSILSFFVKACLSPDGQYLVSGSNDEAAYVWRTKNPGAPFLKLVGHRDEVTCISWCKKGDPKIVTCSDDCYHRIWRVRPQLDFEEEQNIFGYTERYDTQALLDSSPGKCSISSAQSYSIANTPQSCASRSNSEVGSVERPVLSPIKENIEASPKRSSLAARKLLFSPNNKQAIEEQSPSKPDTNECMLAMTFSPTTGLPNFVIDGTAPHLSNSPQKSKENVDWLTKIRKRKRAESTSSDSPNAKLRKTPSSARKTKRQGDLKKTPQSMRCLMPAITNFYSNLNLERERV